MGRPRPDARARPHPAPCLARDRDRRRLLGPGSRFGSLETERGRLRQRRNEPRLHRAAQPDRLARADRFLPEPR